MRTACSSSGVPASARRTISWTTARAWPSGSGARQKRGGGPAASGRAAMRLAARSGIGATTAAAASRIAWVERWLTSSRSSAASGKRRRKSATFLADAPRKR